MKIVEGSINDLHEKTATILAIFESFELVAGHLLARCVSAKRLADWAFEHGAIEVKHAYDLKLSEDEL